jgi:ATP synthase I subunit
VPDRLATSADLAPQGPAGLGQVIRDQRKTIVVGLVLAVAAFWILGQLDEWRLATSLAIGVALGLVNHLATERWLLGVLTSGRQPTRAVMMRATMVRLVVLTVVAVTVAVLFWPDGIGVLLGLAVFRIIALAMTTLPLLKELKEQ